ncbi:MAG TPA: metalloregulator ArsR/SmtB family transcription factor [Gaiellaceae bacterium]|nr:metalloregulator ArsR/SmtB family transcription factor [Gaiellaceae bacterium]
MSMQALPVLQPICCGSDAPPLPKRAADELADRFRALADPTRVAIVNRLSGAAELCVCDLTAAFELSQPTISHHLKILREAGLVEATRRGTWAYYRLVPETVDALRGALGG